MTPSRELFSASPMNAAADGPGWPIDPSHTRCLDIALSVGEPGELSFRADLLDLRKAGFGECKLTRARFDGADLRGLDLSTCRDFYVAPANARANETRVSLDAAESLLAALGFEVAGSFADE